MTNFRNENALRPGRGQAALTNMLQGILTNQQTIADVCGVALPYVADDVIGMVDTGSDMPSKDSDALLPASLSSRVVDKQPWVRAMAEGAVERVADGRLKWNLGSSTLLAYFLGRLLCGDYPMYSRRKRVWVWQKGNGMFPASEVSRLFGVKYLRQLRMNRLGCTVPEGHDVVDKFFLKIKGE